MQEIAKPGIKNQEVLYLSYKQEEKVKQNFNRTVEKTKLDTYDHDTDTSTQKKYKKVTRNPVSRLFPNKKVKEKSSESQSRYVGEAKMDKSSDTYPVYDHTKPYKSKVTKTTTRPSGRTKTITKTEEGGKKTRTKEISQGKPFKWWKSPPPQPSKLQRGGIAQGKSPGVDTPTTIDGTTYYQEGGTVKKFLEGKDEKDDKNISFPYKEKDKGSLISPTIEKEYKVKSWKPTKPTSPKPYEPESNLDKISEDLKKANAQRQAIGTADDIKARKLKREQDKLKQEAKFKKGGKMKYKKGGIVSKLQRGGKGQWDTNTGNPVTDYINTYAQSPEQADLDAFKKERGGYNFGKKHDRLRSRAQNIQSKRENVYSSAKDRSDVNIKKDDRRAARQVRLRDKARGIRSESYGLQKGGIIGKIKKKLKEKKGNWKDVGGKAINTKTPELSPVSTAKDKIKEDLKKGNRY